MTLPLIELLETRWSPLTFLSPGQSRTLLSNPSRAFLPIVPGRTPWADIRRAAALRKERFDIAINAKTSFRSAWIVRLAGIPRRIGHATEGRSFLLTDPVPYEKTAYYAFSMLDLARPLGFTVQLQRPRILDNQTDCDFTGLLEGATVGIQPGASSQRKRISVDLLAATIHCLHEQGFRSVLLGGPEEQPMAQELRAKLECPVVDLVGKTDLKTLTNLLPNLRLVIGADTGVLHLAAATGATTVQVFGPTVYKGWGNAFGSNQVIVAPCGDMAKLTSEKLFHAVSLALHR